jgi:hypothetical protein
MALKVGDLFVQLGIKSDLPILKEFSRMFDDLPAKISATLLELAGIEWGLGKLATKALDTATGIDQFSKAFNVSSEELEKWRNMAVQAHISADAVSNSVSNLRQNSEKLHMGQDVYTAGYAFFGINPHEDPFKMFNKISQKLKEGMNTVKAQILMQGMGIDPTMINLLLLSARQREGLISNAPGLGKERTAALRSEQQSLDEIKAKWTQFTNNLVGDFAIWERQTSNLTIALRGLRDTLAGVAIFFGGLPAAGASAAGLTGLMDLQDYMKGKPSAFGNLVKGSQKPENWLLGFNPLNLIPGFSAGTTQAQNIVNVYAQTNASPADIVNAIEASWQRLFNKTDMNINK